MLFIAAHLLQKQKKNFKIQEIQIFKNGVTIIKGCVDRQEYLETALMWVSNENIDNYMSNHRNDSNTNELKLYFNSVIDWVSSTFKKVEMKILIGVNYIKNIMKSHII